MRNLAVKLPVHYVDRKCPRCGFESRLDYASDGYFRSGCANCGSIPSLQSEDIGGDTRKKEGNYGQV